MAEFFIREFYTNYDSGKPVDYVVISPRGEGAERVATPLRIKDITPPERPNMESLGHRVMVARWADIGPAYEAWKAGNSIPDHGTPLGAWAGISTAQAEHLKRLGATTVENVAALSQEDCAKLPWPDARKLPNLAAAFLEGQKEASAQRENEALKERIAAMEELLVEMPKRGPGRPRKEEADAA